MLALGFLVVQGARLPFPVGHGPNPGWGIQDPILAWQKKSRNVKLISGCWYLPHYLLITDVIKCNIPIFTLKRHSLSIACVINRGC